MANAMHAAGMDETARQHDMSYGQQERHHSRIMASKLKEAQQAKTKEQKDLKQAEMKAEEDDKKQMLKEMSQLEPAHRAVFERIWRTEGAEVARQYLKEPWRFPIFGSKFKMAVNKAGLEKYGQAVASQDAKSTISRKQV
ncbi:hypothetical protein AGMMS49950_10250 [Endomicrobiia bacterium]|nr:hypothetical protein AGMMS49531_10800 [Endomicrobiia bacterium]GHT72101.1 hypothetical protein AGMMS49950_10250 [Endomicrobiia bacterium]